MTPSQLAKKHGAIKTGCATNNEICPGANKMQGIKLGVEAEEIAKNINKAMKALSSACAINFGASKMKTVQQHAQEILPIVTAAANGETVQIFLDGTGKWEDCDSAVGFVNGCKYRIKPRTIMVNGFEVPEPMREEPKFKTIYFLADPTGNITDRCSFEWSMAKTEAEWLSRGLCHTTKEAAIAHAKAMLGIDPNS